MINSDALVEFMRKKLRWTPDQVQRAILPIVGRYKSKSNILNAQNIFNTTDQGANTIDIDEYSQHRNSTKLPATSATSIKNKHDTPGYDQARLLSYFGPTGKFTDIQSKRVKKAVHNLLTNNWADEILQQERERVLKESAQRANQMSTTPTLIKSKKHTNTKRSLAELVTNEDIDRQIELNIGSQDDLNMRGDGDDDDGEDDMTFHKSPKSPKALKEKQKKILKLSESSPKAATVETTTKTTTTSNQNSSSSLLKSTSNPLKRGRDSL